VDIRRDSFTLNTLGNILMRMAADYHEPGTAEADKLFWEGVDLLRSSAREGRGHFEHPFFTFFVRTLSYSRAAHPDGAIDQGLSDEWSRWMREAQLSHVFGHELYASRLAEFQREWLMQVARKP